LWARACTVVPRARRDPDDDGDILTYNMWQYYTAVGPDTAMWENTTVTTLNVPFLGVLNSPLVVGDFLAAGIIQNILQELHYSERRAGVAGGRGRAAVRRATPPFGLPRSGRVALHPQDGV
jgi:hypothetical protein